MVEVNLSLSTISNTWIISRRYNTPFKNKYVNTNTIYCIITFHSICITNSHISNTFRNLKKNSVYYPSFCCYCFINSILYISISISIHAYTYIYLYIYTRICIKKCVVYSSLILPNKSMHQRFILQSEYFSPIP